MGKDWYYYWAGRSSKRGGGGGETTSEAQTTTTPSGCMCAVFQIFDFHPLNHFPTTTIHNNNNHHHQQQQQQKILNKKSPSSIPEDTTTIPKGAEAPRNSLESEDGTASSVTKEEEEEQQQHFKIPIKNIQIKTNGRRNLNNDNLSSSDSPAKTPTLVARLMGLDLLPSPNSPSNSSSSSCISTPNPQNNNVHPNLHHHNMIRTRGQQHILQTKHRNSTDCVEFGATRSLPETPRISSARRSDSDIHHHRLSLQINKENIVGDDLEIVLPRFSLSKRKSNDENNNNNHNNVNGGSRSSSHLAKQIVKQVKESVVMSRKVGQDITNNSVLKTREGNIQAKEELLLNSVKTNKKSSKGIDESSSPGKHSPRLRFTIENTNNNKQNKPNTTTPKEQNTIQQPQFPRVVLTKPKPQQPLILEQKEKTVSSVSKCKKIITNEKFNSRLKRTNLPQTTTDIFRYKQEEPFIVRPTSSIRPINDMKNNNATKCKKTHPLTSNLISNINNVPNLFPIKTEPSPPATKIDQKQVRGTQDGISQQLPSCSSHMYKQERMSTLISTQESENNNNGDNANDDASSASASAAASASASTTGEFQYITGILSRTTNKEEVTTNTSTTTPTASSTVSLSQRFSPLDPSIFDHLEEHPISNSHVSSPKNNKVCIFSMKKQLGQSWNRRLMFDLVDEVLMEIFRPKSSEKKLWFLHGCVYQGNVEGLMEKVWNRIGKFPCKKCEFLEDIDGLIEKEDMEKVKVESEQGLEEEGQVLVGEIEGNIWDTLVHESVMVMLMEASMWGP